MFIIGLILGLIFSGTEYRRKYKKVIRDGKEILDIINGDKGNDLERLRRKYMLEMEVSKKELELTKLRWEIEKMK